jgi:hypothetical protein
LIFDLKLHFTPTIRASPGNLQNPPHVDCPYRIMPVDDELTIQEAAQLSPSTEEGEVQEPDASTEDHKAHTTDESGEVSPYPPYPPGIRTPYTMLFVIHSSWKPARADLTVEA